MTARPTRLVLAAVIALMLVVGCQSKYPGTVRVLKDEIQQARDSGGRFCAPKEFASAEAYLEFALLEIHEQNFMEADAYLATAKTNLDRAQEQIDICRADLDGDGVHDLADAAPYQAEDIDGFEDADGKPEPDNDGDGILDGDDADPNLAEDFDGFEDSDGIPDLDNDQDGVPDQRDAAPDEPEDFDGWADSDGAPDPDNDSDGIADGQDACPTDPETFNRYLDTDGCPDVAPVIRKIVYVKPIRFFSGSSRLVAEAHPILQAFAVRLDENPGMRVRIEGHTDNVGEEKANMRLSQARAERVKAVLAGYGVDESRLEAVGMGESRPITENDTSEGRARNRRINLVILQDQTPAFPDSDADTSEEPSDDDQ